MTDSLPSVPESLDPSDPYARQAQTFPVLTDEQIERAGAFGKRETIAKGVTLFERGERSIDFFIILRGCIEIYEHRKGETPVITVHHEKQFTGELDLFNDRKVLVGGRMGKEGEIVRIHRKDFRRFMASEPDIAEIIMRAFILRRVGLISHAQGSVTLIGHKTDGHALRIEQFLRRNGYPVEVIEGLESETCGDFIKDHGIKEADLPVVILYQSDTVLRRPSDIELADALGIVEEIEDCDYDVAIVGAGPAGLSAAVYAASEGLKTILLEEVAPGGQAATSSKIENYLGFPTGISGQGLAGRAQVQAQKFGARIALPRQVKILHCDQTPYRLEMKSGETVKTKAIVIASGARYRMLDLPNEERFKGAGINYAATALEGGLCENEEIIVVGGGNSAGQAAIFLSRKASHVHMLVRGENLAATMSDYLVERINSSSSITLHTKTAITALEGGTHLDAVTWKTGEDEAETKQIRHVFLMLGALPNTGWLKDCVQLDAKGFLCTGIEVEKGGRWKQSRPPMMLETSLPGVFAAGDVRANSVKRVASAVGEGSMTISHAHQYLSAV